jgi:hypothetical protein
MRANRLKVVGFELLPCKKNFYLEFEDDPKLRIGVAICFKGDTYLVNEVLHYRNGNRYKFSSYDEAVRIKLGSVVVNCSDLNYPMVFTEEMEPAIDKDLKEGSLVFLPLTFPIFERCLVSDDGFGEKEDRLFLLDTMGNTYRIHYDKNWYVISGMPDVDVDSI